MEVNWDFNRKMARLELGLSWGAAIPLAGTICAVAKVVIGVFQTLTAFFVSFYAKITQNDELVNFCEVHQEHGLYNVFAGAFEAIPLVGSLLYMLRCSNKPRGEEYQIITGHEMHLFPYRHLEVSDAEIRLADAKSGTGVHLRAAPELGLIEKVQWSPDTKLRELSFTDSWKGLKKEQKKWIAKWFSLVWKPNPGFSMRGTTTGSSFQAGVDWTPLFHEHEGLKLIDIVQIFKLISRSSKEPFTKENPMGSFKMGEDPKMNLRKLAAQQSDDAALKALQDWEEEIRRQAASSNAKNAQAQHSSSAANIDDDEPSMRGSKSARAETDPYSYEVSPPESPTASHLAEAAQAASATAAPA